MNNATNKVTSLAALALAVSTSTAHAQPAADLIDSVEVETAKQADTIKPRAGRRHLRMLLEGGSILGIGTAWYWRPGQTPSGDRQMGGSNVVDWQLGFKGSSLVHKLDGSGWRFDGNSFGLNAVGHPMFGAMTYFAARKNNYNPAEAFLISTLMSGSWECFTEWAEYGSINDALATSPTGVPLGEAAYQLMHNWRRARYAIQAGAGTQDGDAFVSLGGRVALDTLPTEGAGTVVGGNKINVGVEVPFDGAVRSIEGGVKSSLVGYYQNGENHKLFAGASSEFYYRDQKDRDSRDWDLLAAVAAGPTVDLQVRVAGATVDMGTDVYADFGMLKSEAFDTWRNDHQMAILRNSMQDKAQPYYYAYGVTVDPRINVAYRGMNVGGKVAASLFNSIEGVDRDQEMLTADPHMSDTDATGEAWISYTHKNVTLAVDGRAHHRAGKLEDVRAAATDTTTMFTVAYQR